MSLFALNYRKRRKAVGFAFHPVSFLWDAAWDLKRQPTSMSYIQPLFQRKDHAHADVTCCCQAPVTPAVPLENINKLLCCWSELFMALAHTYCAGDLSTCSYTLWVHLTQSWCWAYAAPHHHHHSWSEAAPSPELSYLFKLLPSFTPICKSYSITLLPEASP